MQAKTNIFGDRVIVGREMKFFLNDTPLTIIKIKRRFELGTLTVWYEAVARDKDGNRRVESIDFFRPLDTDSQDVLD